MLRNFVPYGDKERAPVFGIFGFPRFKKFLQLLVSSNPSTRSGGGTIDQVAVSPRRIIEKALAHHAAGLVIVHNHLSGHTNPSEEN